MNSFKNKWLVALLSSIFAVGLMAADKGGDEKEEKSKGYKKALAAMKFSPERVRERTKPIGKIFVEGDDVPSAAPPPVAESTGPRTGEAVYGTYCQVCHSGAIPNAPAFGSDTWKTLAARGMDDLLASAIAGPTGMPPKGGCADCSDKELSDAIQHMIDSAK